LKTSLKVRQRRWNDFCGFIAKRARKNFEWNLTQRGFTGRLEFDHSKKRLVPYVQPSDETRASKGHDRDPKSLSGGEKSYSTISLLLALWEAMGCPIRCLDEYDVFMDAANRAITTRMIVECASHTSGVQHILISPQNLPYVHNNPNCRILKLNDPERNGGINN
jgi:chromosome segregation ATPase